MLGWGALPPERAPDFFYLSILRRYVGTGYLIIRMWILRISILK